MLINPLIREFYHKRDSSFYLASPNFLLAGKGAKNISAPRILKSRKLNENGFFSFFTDSYFIS